MKTPIKTDEILTKNEIETGLDCILCNSCWFKVVNVLANDKLAYRLKRCVHGNYSNPTEARNRLEKTLNNAVESIRIKAIQLTQSKIISIINERINRLKRFIEKLRLERADEAIPKRRNYTLIIKQTEETIKELESLKKEVKL